MHDETIRPRGGCGGTSPLPPGMTWLPHTGFKQQMRAHRQVWAQFEKLCKRDSYAAATRERLLDYVSELNLPNGEIVAMSVVLKARVHADAEKISWVNALNQALNELEAAQVDPTKGVVI